MRGRKKAGADKVEEVDTPVAVSEDDSEMTPVDEDDAAELEKILVEEEEVVDDSPEIEKEVSKEEAEATEELSNAVVLETAEKPTKAADTIIEKPALGLPWMCHKGCNSKEDMLELSNGFED